MEKTRRRSSAQKLPGLAAARSARGFTQVDLARESGVSRATINKLEFLDYGAQGPTVYKLAAALNVPAALLAEEPGEELEALMAYDEDTEALESGEEEVLDWKEARSRRTASS